MSSTRQASPAGVIREAIPADRLPWMRPLVQAYLQDFASVAGWYAGSPWESASWGRVIRRVQQSGRDSMPACRALARQLDQRGAPAPAKAAAATLAHPATLAVVTGQQAGAFGGPLYTLLKAVTTIQLARRISAAHGVSVVPVFWVHGEDHDWNEVRAARVLTADALVAEVSLSAAGPVDGPVAHRILADDTGAALQRLGELVPPTEFTDDVVQRLARHYRSGAGMAAAFAGWLDDLLGASGLVVFDAADPEVKPAVAGLLAAEIHEPRVSRLAREAAETLRRQGHTPQVEPAEDAIALFYLDPQGRLPIRRMDGGRVLVGEDVRPAEEVAGEARAHPERFSPNVLLRPIVQDQLFPTIAYVAGPGEIAYQAQLGAVYRAFGVEAPLVYPRASATVLDSAAARFLDRHPVTFETLQVQDESVLNRLLEAQLPAEIDRLIDGADAWLVEQATQLKPAVAVVDPTLAGAVDTTIARARETFGQLRHKIVQASKRRDQTMRRQFERTRALAFPDGHPQERVLNVAFFVNRYGPAVVDRLIELLPPETDKHYVLTL
jgi:bacillithiol biosynthesis cysteine-adding enzyme BshC